MRSLKKLEPYYLFIILLLIIIMVAPHLGNFDVNEYDEARNGINAYEMLHNHDYINLYYGGKPDSWNAKPSLLSWCIILSYKIFGFNEWGLRIPSLLFTIGFFFHFYLLIKLLKDRLTAFLSCLLLLACKGILGMHIGLTADFDILLTWFLMASAYHFVQYTDLKKRSGILLTGLYTGLAFYAKGPAAFLYLPGFAVYLFYKRGWTQTLKDGYTWLGMLLSVAIAASWVVIQSLYGVGTSPDQTQYGSKNSLEVLFWHDVVRRFTDADFDHGKYKRDYFYCIHAFDVSMNVWNYVFYLILIIGCVLLYRHRKNISAYLRSGKLQPIIFSISISLPILVFLTISMNPHDWYLAPVWPFIAFITVLGVQYIVSYKKQFGYVFIAAWIALAVRHYIYIDTAPNILHKTFAEHKEAFSTADSVIYLGPPYQHIFLYTKWQDKPMLRIDELQAAYNHPGRLFLVRKEELQKPEASGIQSLFDIGPDYCMARIK